MNLLEKYSGITDDIANIEFFGRKYRGVIYNVLDPVFSDEESLKKKLSNAKQSFGQDISPDEKILMLIDKTLFGSAKDGIIFSDRKIYYKELFEKPNVIRYEDIDRIVVSEKDTSLYLILGDEKKSISYFDFNSFIIAETLARMIIGSSYLIRAENEGVEIENVEDFIWDVRWSNVEFEFEETTSKFEEFLNKHGDTLIELVKKAGINFLINTLNNDKVWDTKLNKLYDLFPAPFRLIISRDRFKGFILENRDSFVSRLGEK